MGPVAIGIQSAAFVIGLGFLGWSMYLAFRDDETRQSLAALFDGGPVAPAGLIGLACLSVLFNGGAFFAILRSARNVPFAHVMGVNALATGLNVLPFKVSAIVRVAAHRRLDGLPYRLLIAWFAALAGTTVGVLGPIALASMFWGGSVLVWWVITIVGVAISTAGCVVGARLVSAHTRLDALTLGVSELLRSLPHVLVAIVLRAADVLAVAGRFYIAAWALDVPTSATQSLLLASAYFLTGVVSPAGALGVREVAVLGAGAAFSETGLKIDIFAAMALTVTAAELIANSALSALGFLYLAPKGLFAKHGNREAAAGTKAEIEINPHAE